MKLIAKRGNKELWDCDYYFSLIINHEKYVIVKKYHSIKEALADLKTEAPIAL